MTERVRPTLSPRMHRAMGAKAVIYGLVSMALCPILSMIASRDLAPLLAAFGLACSLASLLAIVIYRRGLKDEQKTQLMHARLTAGMTAVICLGVGQLVVVGAAVYLQLQ